MAIEDRPVTAADYPVLEKVSDIAIKEKQKFERLVVKKETLLEMFSVSLDVHCGIPDGTNGLSCWISTINTRSTLLNRRFLTVHLRLSIDAVPW